MGLGALTFLELKGQDSHAEKVGSVDSLVRLSDDDLDALEVGTLGSPVTGRAGTVLFTSDDDELLALLLVSLSSIKNGNSLSTGDMKSERTVSVDHLVDETHIGEGTSGHDQIVSSAGTV